MVAVPFAEDPGWYRARVLEVMEDQVDVYYVDYGDSELVPRNQVMTLRYVTKHQWHHSTIVLLNASITVVKFKLAMYPVVIVRTSERID